MTTVNMLEAKSTLSRLVESVETGAEARIIIARNGRPVAQLTALRQPGNSRRIGIAKGKFVVPDNIDADEGVVAAMFAGSAG